MSSVSSLALDWGKADRRAGLRTQTNVALRYRRVTFYSGRRGGAAVVSERNSRGVRIDTDLPLEIGEWIRVESLGPRALRWLGIQPSMLARVARAVPVAPAQSKDYPYSFALDLSVARSGWLTRAAHAIFPLFLVLMFGACFANVLYLKAYNVEYFWYQPVLNLYSLIISFYILSRFLLAAWYRPPADVGYLPSVAVIVACKNEENSIAETIECIYKSDYPRHLMQVIAVNDGSTDGTLREMHATRARHPDLVVINFEKNRGKRHGMAAGALATKADILVYVDSDSFVESNTVRKMVQGFADPEVGAVCGHANVQNADTNALTKMQQVRYYVAFRILKAAESLFSSVSCCSGCLAAYRRAYVMPILDTWLHQRFMGREATFGDDRSLTNFMLRRWRVIYDAEAVCTTIVPDNYRVFFRQQVRWKKSWIRESFIAGRFMWRRHPMAAFSFYLALMFPLLAPVIVSNALIVTTVSSGMFSYLYLYGAALMATLYGLVYLARYRDGMWIYAIAFSFFYMAFLVWQTYYALLTINKNHWGTR